jgi:ATP-dependent helicase/nuclease subunit A
MPEPMAGANVADEQIDRRDRDGRERAVDPRFNVALEASAGTGKTRVLVTRYINLLQAGVAPGNILAMTFTRKAAAEMRTRIVATLRQAAERGELTPSRWREIRERMGDIQISTIDAFCLSLLREFPLEADLDPGFSLADDTDVPRLVDESLDRALRICRSLAREDEHVALVFAQIGDRRARAGLAALLARRLVAPAVLGRYLARAPRDLTIAGASARAAASLRHVFAAMPGGLPRFLRTGPADPRFALLRHALEALFGAESTDVASGFSRTVDSAADPARVQATFSAVREHFLTHDGQPRTGRLVYRKEQFRSASDYQAHRTLVFGHSAQVREAHLAYRRDLNVLVSRGVSRMFRIAESEYRRTLDAHAVLDFPDVLLRTLDLLRQMEEFSQSRYRLESRYHHVLVDEFQDTSRAQWELVALLVQAWGAGSGLAHSGPLPPSIFIVGDRKQSIYGFRDAQASILREAAAYLDQLRPEGDVRRSISRSFRSVPPLLAFVNQVCDHVEKATGRADAFQFEDEDRFPAGEQDDGPVDPDGAVRFLAAASPEQSADLIAAEIARVLAGQTPVRDRDTGVRRAVRPGDIGILFRTRESHRAIVAALERRSIPAYVYKGLGFFDADEIKDVRALLSYLADPASELRAAAFLRSRFVRLSDDGLRRLAGQLAATLASDQAPESLEEWDRTVVIGARPSCRRWVGLVDRLPPAELLDLVLTESAYAVELRGRHTVQARENLKKIRGLIRRMQHRGYATLGRVTAYLDRLAVGDEADAVIDASDAVNLMTVHASKGLEFPIVFVANLDRGTGNRRPPMRISAGVTDDDVSVAVGDFASQADEDDAAREREETKRLLYVALTRARDRLYLSTPLQDGRVVAGKGSLAEVLPPFVIERLEHAAGVLVDELPAEAPDVVAPEPPAADTRPVSDAGLRRLTVAAAMGASTGPALDGRASSRIVGILVHRLLQRGLWQGAADDDELRQRAQALLTPDEAAEQDDVESLCATVVDAFRGLTADEELRRRYQGNHVRHEVPFTLRDGDRILRGTIDCLIEEPGRVTVVEFKTGRPRPEHHVQAGLYTRAVRTAYPGADVETRLIYAN